MTTANDRLYAVAVSPDGTCAYVMDGSAGSVWRIDTSSNAIIKTIVVGGYPWGVAFSPVGGRAYVTIKDDPIGTRQRHRVAVINTFDDVIMATFAVENWPLGVAVSTNGRRLYVLAFQQEGYIDDPGLIHVVDTYDFAIITTIRVNGCLLWGVAVDPDGNRAYLTRSGRESGVLVLDLHRNVIVNSIKVGSRPTGIACSPDGRIYVANSGSQSVSVIHGDRNEVVDTVSVGQDPIGLAVSPLGHYVYVTNSGSDSVSVIDSASCVVIDTLPVDGGPWGIAISPDGRRGYITGSASRSVSAFNPRRD